MFDPVIIQAIQLIGFPAVLVILFIVIGWKVIIPAIVKRDEETRKYYETQIATLQSDAKEDRRIVLQIVQDNTRAISNQAEATEKLATALNNVNTQLAGLTQKVSTLESDVNKVYRIVAEKKQLITEEKY